MNFTYDEAATTFVRQVQAAFVRISGAEGALLVEDHLNVLESELEAEIRALLTSWLAELDDVPVEHTIRRYFYDPTQPDGIANLGRNLLAVYTANPERTGQQIRETLKLALDFVMQQADSDRWRVPIPINLLAAVRSMFDVVILPGRYAEAAERFFVTEFDTRLSVVGADGTSFRLDALLDGRSNAERAISELLNSLEDEVKLGVDFAELFEPERTRLGDEGAYVTYIAMTDATLKAAVQVWQRTIESMREAA